MAVAMMHQLFVHNFVRKKNHTADEWINYLHLYNFIRTYIRYNMYIINIVKMIDKLNPKTCVQCNIKRK